MPEYAPYFTPDKMFGMGDFKKEGWVGRASEHSKGQDSFAANPETNTFVVCDGSGSYTDSGPLAIMLAKAIAKNGIPLRRLIDDTIKNLPQGTSFPRAIQSAIQLILNTLISGIAKSPEYIREIRKLKNTPHPLVETNKSRTTISILQKMPNNKWIGIVIGDSPIFVCDEDSNGIRKITSIGLKAQKISGTGTAVGIDPDGSVTVSLGNIAKGIGFSACMIESRPNRKILMTSDWFPEMYYKHTRDYAEEELERLKKQYNTAISAGGYYYVSGVGTDTFNSLKTADGSIDYTNPWLVNLQREINTLTHELTKNTGTKFNIDVLLEKIHEPQSFKDLIQYAERYSANVARAALGIQPLSPTKSPDTQDDATFLCINSERQSTQ